MEIMDEIAGCPYCGGEAEMVVYHRKAADRYSVRCKSKHCRGRAVKSAGTKSQAIREWNQRPTPAKDGWRPFSVRR